MKKVLASRKLGTGVGDEGGFAPDLPSHEAALDLIVAAVEQAGYRPGEDVVLALDAGGLGVFRQGQRGIRLQERGWFPPVRARP